MPFTSRFALLAWCGATIAVAGCGDADPLSKSHDIAARTVGRDLTTAQLLALVARSKTPIAGTVENGVIVADLWADYQRLGYAAAHGDSLESHFDAVLAPAGSLARVNGLLDALRKPMARDTATKATYDSAARHLYAIRHILFVFPPKATQAQKDSIGKFAGQLRAQLTPANFADMARKYSSDSATRLKGGYLGVLSTGLLNPPAATVISSLKPDSISKPLRTQLGVDIVQRVSWTDAGTDYAAAFSRAVNASLDSAIIDKRSTAANLTVTSSGPTIARAAVANPIAGARDSAVIATFDNGGKFTAADLIMWMNLMEPAPRLQVLKDLPEQSDIVVKGFVRNVASRAVLLRAADSARIVAPDSLRPRLHAQFRSDLVRMWTLLGVLPEQLADSAKTVGEKEQLAARRVDRFLERGMSSEVVMSPVPVPLEMALNAAYPATVSIPAVTKVMVKR